jgi:hypothetical protein
VLSELLAHFGLSDFEAALNADKFGVENLLQVCARAVFAFCIHSVVPSFIALKNFVRYSTSLIMCL